MAKESKELYYLHAPESVDDMALQTNTVFQRLASRLDLIEGFLGNPTFKTSINMDGNSITALADPSESTDAVPKSYADGFQIPVGFCVISTVSTDPATALGYGTWALTCAGRMVVGYSSGDEDFGTLGGTGGTKTHNHSNDPPSTTSGPPSDATGLLGTGAAGAPTGAHTHDVDIAAFDSADGDNLPPFQVFYIWVRTA